MNDVLVADAAPPWPPSSFETPVFAMRRQAPQDEGGAGAVGRGESPRGRAGRRARLARLPLRSGVGNAPDGAAGVVGDEQRAVLHDGERGGPAPHLGAVHAGGPEAGGEILVPALR